MKTLNRISMAMIGIPLLVMLWSARWYIFFEPPTRAQIEAGTSHYVVVSDAMDVHEAGFARIALAIIGLLILFIPYRKGERWAFAALAVLIICYGLPVFFFWSIPNLGTWQIFRSLPEPPVLGLATVYSYTHLFTILAFAGLAIAVPYFITSRRNARLKELQTP
jgi:hypothetical protein